ncbi:MAG: NADH-quinone oxidoreductase subunit C/D [Syntrophomonadaceae bacterium]
MKHDFTVIEELKTKFGNLELVEQKTADGMPTLWVPKESIAEVLGYLKNDVAKPYKMLYDLAGIDERERKHREGQPICDFTVMYQLMSFERNSDIRLKIALKGEYPTAPSVIRVFQNANWYERETFDMFGIKFDGHPFLKRILMPPWWEGHPLRKEHPARATEMGPFQMPEDKSIEEQEVYQFKPEAWGLVRSSETTDFMFLNLGPQHPGTHGVLRLVLQLDGEIIVDIVPDIGFHHRGQEKMAERQSWHTYLPYTDRVDYLAGVVNNLAYLSSLEELGKIEIPERAKVIRVMLCEIFRVYNHLVWLGTFAQDVGQLSPVFYTFTDREKALSIIEAVTGFRMHPGWFRIGGTAQDLPKGWDTLVKSFLDYMPPRLREYEKMVMRNQIFKARTVGVGLFNIEEATEWGITGPNLRACGLEWDLRKKRPFSGYEQFEFDIPTAENGDCYGRAQVRMEEMRQSLRIIEQCLNNMPEGSYKSTNPLTTPPLKDRTMMDIETLINHFLNVSWGPVMPPGESSVAIETIKGITSYYLISDGSTGAYRNHIRTPSFAHMQMVPFMSRSYTIADLMAILGSLDFVLADVDR